MRFKIRFAIVAVVLGSMSVPGQAADRDTLKNIRAIDVLIETLPPEVESDGLTTAQLQADVESRLRESGIQISKDASEAFYVNVNAHRTTAPGATVPEDRYMYNVEVNVNQPVVVLRTNALELGTTWSRATVGMTLLPRLVDSVRGDVRDILDMFIDDFQSVNPKP